MFASLRKPVGARLTERLSRHARVAFRAVAGLVALGALAACDDGLVQGLPGAGAVTGGSSGGSVNVAVLVPKGASNPGVAFLGSALETSARLAASEIRGATVNLTVYDTAGSAGQAAARATEAVAAGADVIVGPLFAENANAVGLAVAGTGTPVLAFSNNPEIAGGNVFILGNTFQNGADRVVQYARGQGKRRMLVVHARTTVGSIGRDAVLRALAQNGVENAGAQGYDFSVAGLEAQVRPIADRAREAGADAILFTSDNADVLNYFGTRLPEAGAGPDALQYATLARVNAIPAVVSSGSMDGAWFATPDLGRIAAYRNRFKGAAGAAPEGVTTVEYDLAIDTSSVAFDAVAAIGALVARGGRDPLSLANLAQSSGYQGATGIFRLRGDGTNQRALAVATMREGRVVTLDGAPNRFGSAGF
ncbi:MAG: penicillin-binding protein activator [Shimia sp.]